MFDYHQHHIQREIEHQLFMQKLKAGDKPMIVREKRMFVNNHGWINVELLKPH